MAKYCQVHFLWYDEFGYCPACFPTGVNSNSTEPIVTASEESQDYLWAEFIADMAIKTAWNGMKVKWILQKK